jgi:hypothetical protein
MGGRYKLATRQRCEIGTASGEIDVTQADNALEKYGSVPTLALRLGSI